MEASTQNSTNYPTWEQSRKKLVGYARRSPEQSVLYRAIFHYAEELERVWDERFQAKYGVLRQEVIDAFRAFLDCGIVAHGCARAYCAECHHTMLISLSCKRRGLCPSCDAKRSLIFAEHLHENVLPALPLRHLVFTLPKRLRVYYKYNRNLCKHLYTSAWNAWQSFSLSKFPELTEAKPGAVMALHTAGDLLNFHPHVHTIMLDGVVTPDGTFHRLTECDVEIIRSEFEQNILCELLSEELITEEVMDGILAQRHTGFSVYSSEPIKADNADARRFVARYLKKSPIALDRLSLDRISLVEPGNVEPTIGSGGSLTYEHINSPTQEPTIVCSRKLDDTEENRTFTPLEFLAEVTSHVPNKWEQTTRFFGVLAARSRKLLDLAKQVIQLQTQIRSVSPVVGQMSVGNEDGSSINSVAASDSALPLSGLPLLPAQAVAQTVTQPVPQPVTRPTKAISKLWSIWIKKIYEVDPLTCPRCQAQMKIVAFIHDPKEIAKLTKNLGIQQQRAPPLKSPKPPGSPSVRYFEPDLTQLQEQGRGE